MMDDIRSTLGRMRRPPFLVRAARIGAAHYLRERVLGRVLGPGPLPVPASALRLLFEIESEAERARRARAAAYSAARHVELLIAVMGEAIEEVATDARAIWAVEQFHMLEEERIWK